MVRLALRQLIRATQRVEFGGPSIVDKKPKMGVPGVSSMQDLKHNYSLTPLIGCLTVGAVVCAWYIYELMHPKDMMVMERSNEPDEKIAKGFFGWFYQSNKDVEKLTPVSPQSPSKKF